MNTILTGRCQALQSRLIENKIDSLLVSSPANVTYLTGVYPISHYEREAFLLVTPKEIHLFFSQFRQSEFENINVYFKHILSGSKRLSQYLNDLVTCQTLWFESDDLTWKEYQFFSNTLGKNLAPSSNIIEELRLIKDKLEIRHLTQAGSIVTKAWQELQPFIKTGVTEKFLAWKLHEFMHQLGTQGIPYGFEPIVAFGAHSASPHHTPTATKLKKNDIVLADFGACINGYASDFTRTLLIGDLPDKYHQIYNLVLEAYQAGVKKLLPNTNVSQVDTAVFNVFEKSKKGELFIHTSGHGIGLAVHEPPSIYRTPTKDYQLKPGMVVTLEPGLYLANLFGVRHENTLLITKSKPKEITG